MTKKQYKTIVQAMDKQDQEFSEDPKKAREFLQKTGIYTPSGRLAKHYRVSSSNERL